MSEQQFQGTLASGGSFIATSRGIRILDPAGNELASFGREVISGINREGQVVTVERHADTIITITAGSITDAVGLEQFVHDSILAAPPPADQPGTPPLALDAFDDDAPGEPRPQIISRLDPSFYPEEERPSHDLPEPVPTTPPESQGYPPPETPDRPETPGAPPPTTTPPMADSPPQREGGRPIWVWGCIGCGGLIVLGLICTGIMLATGSIDVDEITGEDDATPTPFIIVATEPDDDATPTAAGSGGDQPTPTTDATGDDQPTPTSDGTDEEPATPPPAGEVMGVGDSGTLSGMQLTYLGSRTDTGGIFPPDEGNEYLILRFRVENTTAEAAFVSTLLQFQLHNEEGEEFELGLFADIEEVLDVEIPAGETIEGEVAFEVPEGTEGYRVTYDDLITQSSLIWAVE